MTDQQEAEIAKIDARIWWLEKHGWDAHSKYIRQLQRHRKDVLRRRLSPETKRYIGVILFMLLGASLYFALFIHEVERNRRNASGARVYDRNGVAYDTYGKR